MIAMQYSFTLPVDYDMEIIDRRIRDKGPMFDGFPRLRFKAYLSARKQNDSFASAENLYAPFYLWENPKGLSDFLASPGFAALTRDYGWPTVRTWMVWHAELGSDFCKARFASREITPIAPYSDLASRRNEAVAFAEAAVRGGALAAVAAFDPTGWTMVRFRLWETPPTTERDTVQTYTVGHISLPKMPS
ncbi:DUF4865 family protein [Ensifer sp. B1-9]|uniref:DUF4865 family protein n=1 Tax=Ensifer sp. B1-9 TaxID=3141455 RepID=UPI003D23772D